MKRIIIFISVAVISAMSIFGAAYKMSDSKTPSYTHPNIVAVSLLTNKAQPDVITIHPGQYVQFNSKDGKTHIVAQGAGTAYGAAHDHETYGLESQKFGPADAYRVLFKKTGIYDFHDHLNPNIHVSVVVNNNT